MLFGDFHPRSRSFQFCFPAPKQPIVSSIFSFIIIYLVYVINIAPPYDLLPALQSPSQVAPAHAMGHDISKPTGEPVSFDHSGVSVPAAFSPTFGIQKQNPKQPRNQKQKKMRNRRAQKDEGPLNLGARTHPSIPMLCPDWVWSTMSNVRYVTSSPGPQPFLSSHCKLSSLTQATNLFSSPPPA